LSKIPSPVVDKKFKSATSLLCTKGYFLKNLCNLLNNNII